jgi:hypothetical protein
MTEKTVVLYETVIQRAQLTNIVLQKKEHDLEVLMNIHIQFIIIKIYHLIEFSVSFFLF